jgi:signal transduction histidine kinase
MMTRVMSNMEMSFGDTVRITIHNNMTDGTIEADADLLIGVFDNLIKNGIEHVEDLEDEVERCITIRMDNEDGHVVVRINNKGEPVPSERLATFFEKFNTDRKKQGGTGLGTTYAYLVTRAHGGALSVASNETEGTTLTVMLPQPAKKREER